MSKDSNFGKFLLLWAGEFISAIGGGLTSFGLGVYVFNETGSAASMALVTLLSFLPMLVLSVPAGILADRYDRRILMMLGDGLSALGLVYILVRMLMGGATLVDICIGVTISSVFSALLEPSYKATVSDMLTKEEFSKANGLVSIAGSARYLISPVIAGFLLAVGDIRLILLIDICTFFITVLTTAFVRKGITSKISDEKVSFRDGIKEGFAVIKARKGVMTLIVMTSVITCFIGIMMTLSEPMVLAFKSSKTLGVVETICASGMLVTSVVLGAIGIKKHFAKLLSVSLALSGIGMAVFGLKENIVLMTVAGFFFFAMLPVANNCLDYLIRINIPEQTQGRAWGIIGFISQLGYVVAFALSGALADVTAKVMEISVGRGAGLVITVAGILLSVVSLSLLFRKRIRNLENAVG